MVAVDAGVHLSAITRILEETQPPSLGQPDRPPLPHTLTSGPFADLELPHASASANAAHVHRSLIDTYLITHPHLDHISGFIVNTAGLPGSRPKRLAGLPSTIAAFKTHIFNNVIWPNLSDENNGAGLVTYMRLVEGGSPAFGDGDGKGYLEISDGLAVKIWGVSHGHCIERHVHRGSAASTRYGSVDASSVPPSLGPTAMGMGSGPQLLSPRAFPRHNSSAGFNTNSQQQQSPQHQQQRDQQNGGQQGVVPGSTAASGGSRTRAGSVPGAIPPTTDSVCVYDSSAYFIRDVVTGREILIFGDVEPDSISLSPRNQQIWQEAAPKIAAGKLTAIFIECSYDDSQSVDRLFGHLTPRFIVEEMTSLAGEVNLAKMSGFHRPEAKNGSTPRESVGPIGSDKKKRKREGDEMTLARKATVQTRRAASVSAASQKRSSVDEPVSPTTVRPSFGSSSQSDDLSAGESPHIATPTAQFTLGDVETAPFPLKGLKVVLIHLKEKLDDGPHIGQIILDELLERESEAQLGCEFIVSHSGQSLYL